MSKGRRTTICLVRHGETDWNARGKLQGREDVPLNARGREQARRAGLALRAQRWDTLVSSPLRRAWETAAIIGALVGLPAARPEPAFVERDYGAACGMTPDEVRARWPDGAVPGAEDYAAIRARCAPALLALVREHAGGGILVVAHGAVINVLLAVASDEALGTGKTRLRNACLSVLHHRDDTWAVVAHNTVDHLQPDVAGQDG
jgi:uncharacterized phosphatase